MAIFMEWLARNLRPDLAALFLVAKGESLFLMECFGFEKPSERRMPLGMDPWRWLAEKVLPAYVPECQLNLSGPMAVEDWEKVAGSDPLAALAPEILRHGIRASLTVPILSDRERLGG